MTPSQSLISRVLALPLEARRALAEQPGAGWWAQPGGLRYPVRDSAQSALAFLRDRGWAWLPADSLAWLNAATAGTGEWWGVGPDGAVIIRGGPTGDVLAEDPDPRICALDYLEARR